MGPDSHLERVFVSGEDGSLARALIVRLRALGSEIINDKLPKTWQSRLSGKFEVDALDKNLQKIFADLKPTMIVHAAGLVMSKRCELDPVLALRCNTLTAVNMALCYQACSNKPFFVHFGTTAYYDVNAKRPYTEASSISPSKLYGHTKYWGEVMINHLVDSQDLLVLRPGFVFGGLQDRSSHIMEIISNSDTDCGVIETEVRLDRSYYKDFVYIDDFAEMALRLITNRVCGTWHVASGTPRQWGSALDMLRYLGIKSKIIERPEMDYLGDQILDCKNTLDLTDYEPLSLEQGIALADTEFRRSLHG